MLQLLQEQLQAHPPALEVVLAMVDVTASELVLAKADVMALAKVDLMALLVKVGVMGLSVEGLSVAVTLSPSHSSALGCA